jgi:hypothetical protein
MTDYVKDGLLIEPRMGCRSGQRLVADRIVEPRVVSRAATSSPRVIMSASTSECEIRDAISSLCQSQLTVGKKTWLCKLPWLPPILVPPPEAQIAPFTKADP